MVYSFAIFYILFIVLMFYIVSKYITIDNDIFSPLKFFLIFTAFELPYALKIITNKSSIPYYALNNISDFDYVYSLHIINSIVYIISVIVGYQLLNVNGSFLSKVYFVRSYHNKKGLLKSHFILFIIGFISFYSFLNSIGGLFYLLENLDSKSAIIQGTGYYQAIYIVSITLSCGSLVAYYGGLNKISIPKKIYLLSFVIFCFLLLASTGSRKGPMLLVLYILVVWNYNVQTIKLLRLKNIVIGFLGLIYFSMMPLFRTEGAFEYYMLNISELIIESFNNFLSFFDRFSDLDRSLLVYSLFDVKNLWLGSSFIDLIYAPLPRGLFPNKPPMDSGVYLYNMAHGSSVFPTTPLSEMIAVGWPFTTITNMYANFWFPGVILGGLLFGCVLKYFRRLTERSDYNFISLFFYTGVIFGDFAFTNIKIVGFLTQLVFVFIILRFVIPFSILKLMKSKE